MLEGVLSNPIIVIVMALLVGLVVFSLMKKLLKLAFVVVLGLAVIIGYFALTGQKPPEGVKRIQDAALSKVKSGIKNGGKAAGDKLKTGAKVAVDAVKGEMKDGAKAGANAVKTGATESAKPAVDTTVKEIKTAAKAAAPKSP